MFSICIYLCIPCSVIISHLLTAVFDARLTRFSKWVIHSFIHSVYCPTSRDVYLDISSSGSRTGHRLASKSSPVGGVINSGRPKSTHTDKLTDRQRDISKVEFVIIPRWHSYTAHLYHALYSEMRAADRYVLLPPAVWQCLRSSWQPSPTGLFPLSVRQRDFSRIVNHLPSAN